MKITIYKSPWMGNSLKIGSCFWSNPNVSIFKFLAHCPSTIIYPKKKADICFQLTVVGLQEVMLVSYRQTCLLLIFCFAQLLWKNQGVERAWPFYCCFKLLVYSWCFVAWNKDELYKAFVGIINKMIQYLL